MGAFAWLFTLMDLNIITCRQYDFLLLSETVKLNLASNEVLYLLVWDFVIILTGDE